ncbi:MAG: transketolase family protein [Actinomycetota bacterium]
MVNPEVYLVENLFSPTIKQVPTRNGFGEGLLELGKTNPNVWALSGDLTESTRALAFSEQFPERFVEMGVAEQNMAGLASGLGLEGKIPFVCSFAVFSPGRNWDQIRVSIAYSKSNVKIAGSHAGVSTGEDGATHQALEDIAMMRALPNFVVVSPCDATETKRATMRAADIQGPVYLRFHREKSPVFTTEKTPFEVGRAEIFLNGDDLTIIACGPILYEALVAAHQLEEEKISARVINCHTIKPIDEETIIKAARETGAVVTAEEHQKYGGLGGAVAEVLAKNFPVPMEMVAVDDTFGESGEARELLAKYGLTTKEIREAVLRVLKRK